MTSNISTKSETDVYNINLMIYPEFPTLQVPQVAITVR